MKKKNELELAAKGKIIQNDSNNYNMKWLPMVLAVFVPLITVPIVAHQFGLFLYGMIITVIWIIFVLYKRNFFQSQGD